MSRNRRLGLGLAVTAGMLAYSAQGRGELMVCGVGPGWGMPIAEPIDTNRVDGFSVAAGATDLQDTQAPALFTAMEGGDWLAAIRLLETFAENDDDTLIRDNAGMLRPLSTLRDQVLAELPAEGRRTYRAMYSPLANKLLQDAQQAADADEQQAILTELVEQYALCEAAAAAADRLGDLHFERGRFAEAARLYNFAADHPDGDVDDARLLAKRLHAIARAGDWAGFEALAQYAVLRRGTAVVRVGGEDRPLAEVIDTLAAMRDHAAGPVEGVGPAPRIPAHADPVVNLELTPEQTVSMIRQAVANQGLSSSDAIARPDLLSAGGRVYALWLGQLAAIHPHTGETLWAHGNADDLGRQITNQSHALRQGYHQSLQQSGDHLVVTAHEPQNLYLVRLRVHDTATGELQWTSANLGEQAQRSFIGRPTVAGDTLYAVTKAQHEHRLTLVAMDLDDGAVRWSVDLGQSAIDPNWGEPRGVDPRVAVGERYVTVLTNNGALIAIDPVHHRVAWALTYGILPSAPRHIPMMQQASPGNVVAHGGVVLSKDARDDRLVAIGEGDAVRRWSVQVDPGATLVHADDRHAYLLGDELAAYDLRTGERVWWTRHHGDRGQPPAFTETHALIAGPRRMCRIDLTTGKVDGYREDIPAGPTGSPVVRVNDGVAVVTPTGLRIYETGEED